MASSSFAPKVPNGHRVTLANIDAVVSARLGPTRGLGKSQPACFNRQVAMYLASHVGRWSTTVIGRFYGGRDHSTVVHSIQRVEAMREAEPDLDALLCDLKMQLQAPSEGGDTFDIFRPAIRMLASNESDTHLLASEIAAQVGELLREALCRPHEVREFRGAGIDDLSSRRSAFHADSDRKLELAACCSLPRRDAMTVQIELGEDLYRFAAEVAAEQNVPVDQLLASVCEERLRDIESLKQRATRGSRGKFLQVMDKVPDVPPPDYDRL